MLTLHTADVLLTADGSPVPGPYAVLVGAGRIVALGPAAELAGAHPGARERRWPGVLTAGLWHTRAAELLQGAYHPDPREADALGTEPLTGAALSALAPDGTRWGGSDRRGVQRLLARGVTTVSGPFARPSAHTAVARSGLRTRPAPPGAPELTLSGAPAVGGPADLAVFALPGAPDPRALTAFLGGAEGADGPGAVAARLAAGAECVATVLGGRLVHRRA